MENSDEEFDIEADQNTDTATSKRSTTQRMKDFCYYLVISVETNLEFCLQLLEDRQLSQKPSSGAITAASTLANLIPYVGKGLGQALKKGEVFIHNKIDRKNAKAIADLVYFFNDNKEEARKMLIEASTETFFCFERQFVTLKCDDDPRRAMQKLAKDAANRFFTYLLENRPEQDVTKDDFTKGILFGNSLKNSAGAKSGKSVKNEGKKWKTSNIYTKVGLVNDALDEFFGKKDTESKKYGYRRLFSWENIEKIREDWSREDSGIVPRYDLTREDLEKYYPDFREYIMVNIAEEKAELDREKKHEESLSDRKIKHEEILHEISEKHRQVLDEVLKCYEEIKLIHSILKKTDEKDTDCNEDEQIEVIQNVKNEEASGSGKGASSTSNQREASAAEFVERQLGRVCTNVRESGFLDVMRGVEKFFDFLGVDFDSD